MKNVWRSQTEDAELMKTILLESLGMNILALGAGYFSLLGFPENEKLSEILQQAMVQVLHEMEPLSPKYIALHYINLLSAMQLDWLPDLVPDVMKKLAKGILKFPTRN